PRGGRARGFARAGQGAARRSERGRARRGRERVGPDPKTRGLDRVVGVLLLPDLVRPALGHEFVPAHRLASVVDLLHRDAPGHGADQAAQVASGAFVLLDSRHTDAGGPDLLGAVQIDALVRAVVAGDVAKLTADALARVDLRDNAVV